MLRLIKCKKSEFKRNFVLKRGIRRLVVAYHKTIAMPYFLFQTIIYAHTRAHRTIWKKGFWENICPEFEGYVYNRQTLGHLYLSVCLLVCLLVCL